MLNHFLFLQIVADVRLGAVLQGFVNIGLTLRVTEPPYFDEMLENSTVPCVKESAIFSIFQNLNASLIY